MVKDVPPKHRYRSNGRKWGQTGCLATRDLGTYDGGISYVGSNLSLWTISFVLTI